MQSKVVSALLAGAAVASACVIPPGTLSNTITTPFRVQVQNASYPEINNQYMNLLAAGGGDQHLFVGPVGVPTYDLTLLNGVITHGDIRAVIGGEFSDIDHTTKMFMTNRGDPRAIYQPTYVCNPVTDALQIELTFVTMQNNPPGGWNCVRPTFDNAHEFRYYPPGNTLNDPNRFCKKVTLVAVFTGGGTTLSTVSSAPATSSSSSSTPVVSSTSSPPVSSTSSPPVSSVSTPSSSSSSSSSSTSSSVPVNSNLPYTDMTGLGFRFLGCSPEERRVVPPDQPVRTLPSASLAGDDMTNEKCMAFCAGLGYAYAGSEYRRECWCGNSYLPTRQPATTLASLANCNFRCAGNAAQYCGGDSWLSLYQKCPVGGPCVNAVFT